MPECSMPIRGLAWALLLIAAASHLAADATPVSTPRAKAESLKALGSPAAATLSAALLHAHQVYASVAANNQIALGWFYESQTGNYWHNGATAAHSVYVFFNPQRNYAAAVLLNTSPGAKGAFVERLGQHISQRLTGKPAISLAQ
jgi:serine-type D-Ala-D-Ala carboxypeptidase/endopeptidase